MFPSFSHHFLGSMCFLLVSRNSDDSIGFHKNWKTISNNFFFKYKQKDLMVYLVYKSTVLNSYDLI